jgi:hypothetical protein
MKTNLFKTFQPFINKCKKSSLPSCGYVNVENGKAFFTDLETWIEFPTELNDGMYNVLDGEAFKINSANPDEFPILPILRVKSSCLISSNLILQYASCILSDELRPVMNAIYLDNENIVASDCHILKYQSGYSDSSDNDFKALFKPSVALLSRCRSALEPITIQTAWSDDQNAEADPKYLQFSFSDCTITQRMVDGNYPNWKSVIPKYSPTDTVTFLITPSLLADMVKTVKAFKNKTNLVKVSTTAMVHSNDELELKREWPVQWCETPYRTPDSILMPMMICNDQSNGTSILGFEPKKRNQTPNPNSNPNRNRNHCPNSNLNPNRHPNPNPKCPHVRIAGQIRNPKSPIRNPSSPPPKPSTLSITPTKPSPFLEAHVNSKTSFSKSGAGGSPSPIPQPAQKAKHGFSAANAKHRSSKSSKPPDIHSVR